MSGPRRKRSIHGITTVDSEKWDRRVANRRLRRIVRERLKEDPRVMATLIFTVVTFFAAVVEIPDGLGFTQPIKIWVSTLF